MKTRLDDRLYVVDGVFEDGSRLAPTRCFFVSNQNVWLGPVQDVREPGKLARRQRDIADETLPETLMRTLTILVLPKPRSPSDATFGKVLLHYDR